MSLIHDVIKINLTREGYLPNYPYHLISDSEMCDAFMKDGQGYFYNEYPLLDESLKSYYDDIVTAIQYHIDQCKKTEVDEYTFPDWIYSYMLGSVISVNSDPYEIQYLADMLNLEVEYGEFSSLLSSNCLKCSQDWIRKLPKQIVKVDGKDINLRPPTIFGEPHVIKYLRLKIVAVGEVMYNGIVPENI